MRERELKFTPGPSFRLPDLTEHLAGVVADPPSTIRLQAAYFDTPDLRLARSGASLRFRDDQGWVVKLPVSRDEVLTRLELEIAGEACNEPPVAAVDLVHALIRTADLGVVARLNTVRQRVLLRDADGAPLAEVVDDEVSVLDGAHLSARFRELEVEFTDSSTAELVDAIVETLHAAGAGHPDPVPKIVRALGPRALDPPDLPETEELDEASTPVDVLRAAIASSTARLIAHDPGVRLGTDAEDVHQARVATRRMRSDLRTFHTVVDPAWSASLRDELEWIGGLLGAVRDTDVLLARLEGRLVALGSADTDAGNHLLDGLRGHRDVAREELLVAMREDRYLALLDRLIDSARHVPGPPDAGDLGVEAPDLVRKPWRKLREAADALDDDSPDAEFHAVRILAKRCRYAAEAVAPAVGKPARQFARRIAALQEVLGEHQDAVIAGDWLRAHAADGGGTVASAFVAGELAALERAAADASRELWPETWRQARDRHLREWL